MKREPMRTGQIDLIVLAIVARKPAHGYAIIEALRVRSGGLFDLPEGTIYPALYRLEQGGFLTSDATTVSGRSRRTYRVTPSGRTALRDRRSAWQKLVRSIDAVVEGGPIPDHG